jgi:hypothetical protein
MVALAKDPLPPERVDPPGPATAVQPATMVSTRLKTATSAPERECLIRTLGRALVVLSMADAPFLIPTIYARSLQVGCD